MQSHLNADTIRIADSRILQALLWHKAKTLIIFLKRSTTMSNTTNLEVMPKAENTDAVVETGAKVARKVNWGLIGKIGLGVGAVIGVIALAIGLSNKNDSEAELNQPDEGQVIEPSDDDILEVYQGD
jgi:hypothetical protein